MARVSAGGTSVPIVADGVESCTLPLRVVEIGLAASVGVPLIFANIERAGIGVI